MQARCGVETRRIYKATGQQAGGSEGERGVWSKRGRERRERGEREERERIERGEREERERSVRGERVWRAIREIDARVLLV